MKKLFLLIGLLLCAVSAQAQTQEQTIITVTSLPAACNVGDVVMLIAGGSQGIYACLTANTWTLPGGLTNKTEDFVYLTGGCNANIGVPVNAVIGSSNGIDFPTSSPSSVVCAFAVPEAMDVTQPAYLELNYQADAAPGLTNNKVGIAIRYKDGNNSTTALTTNDIITLPNSTNRAFYVGTDATIAANVLTIGDHVEFEIYRDTTVSNNAAVNFFVALARIQYTRKK